MQKDNLPFYYKNWFLIILFLIGPATFYITSIAAIVLMLSRDKALLTVTKEEHAKYQEILAQQHEADSIVINAKSDAKQIINDAKKDAENIITEANNKKEKINDEVLTLEKEKEKIWFDFIRTCRRELLKAQKEEIREQQKVEKELQNAKRKLEKEEKQFNNELSKLMKYLNSAQNEVEKNIYADKIKELEEKIKVLEKDKQNVLERETNTRAGYVYIISNIGSFGKDVYKIGMTRRLEPMDRISELSSASVPFPFDVHALIFSEDAPALENTLHKYFKKQEVNKVNQRKEFFKVNLEEIKELVHKEYNNTVHFTDLAAAEQYFESLKIEQQETAS